ncbi:MAG: iron chelate uptake ABC transporter family permease subunit [Dehalococcoidia bacterium]
METTYINKLAAGLVAHRRKRYLSIAGLLGLLVIVIGIACSIGTADISFTEVWRVLLSKLPFVNIDEGISGTVSTIVIDYRLPRILLAGLVGAALSTAGATFQGIFRNPLADPYLLGVAQGAGLGAVIGFMLPFSHSAVIGSIPLMALCGGGIVIVTLYFLARVGKTLPLTTLILAGVALGAFLSAITLFLLTRSGESMHGILVWLMGSFTNSEWNEVYVLAPYLIISLIPVYIYSRPLNLIQMDEDQAKQLGVNVEKVKLILLLMATLITAAAVSFAGCIGFVGIIIPHAVRLIWGPDYRFLLPLSTIVGAIFLILTDTLARTASGTAEEIPVGVITALIGAPFFLYLLRQKKRVLF